MSVIPDSDQVELNTSQPMQYWDVQRIRYHDKFNQKAVDVRHVTDRVLKMCRTLRNKSFKSEVKTPNNNHETRGIPSDAFRSLAIEGRN